MILLLGANTSVGQAFALELRSRGRSFVPLARDALDYSKFDVLFDYVRNLRPELVINADRGTECDAPGGSKEMRSFSSESVTAPPNMSYNQKILESVPSMGGQGTAVEEIGTGAWENHGNGEENRKAELFLRNTLMPQTIGTVCSMTNTPLGHVSSTCIFQGAKVFERGEWRLETNLEMPAVRAYYLSHPEHFVGFNESDRPNCSFRLASCSYEAGTTALGEECLQDRENTFIWRAGSFFDETDSTHNLLARLLHADTWPGERLFSPSHMQEFVSGCLDLVDRNASYGIYNLTNPGVATTRDIVRAFEQQFKKAPNEDHLHLHRFDPERRQVWPSSCLIDSRKAARAGARMRPARAAVEQSISAMLSGLRTASKTTLKRDSERNGSEFKIIDGGSVEP